MVKCKLLDECLSTLHGGGQNVYRMIFSNPCDQGCLKGETMSMLFHLTNHSDVWLLRQPQAKYETGVLWRSCHQQLMSRWCQSIPGAALRRQIRYMYAGFFKLITIYFNAIFARTLQVHVVLCSLFINWWAAQITVLRFYGLPLKRTS